MFELISLSEFKQQAIKQAENKSIELAINYSKYYQQSQISVSENYILNLDSIATDPKKRKKLYIQQCESMVTPFLFQSPALVPDFNREEFFEAFKYWDANRFVILFCTELRKLMNG